MQFFNSGKIFHKKVGQGGGIFQKKIFTFAIVESNKVRTNILGYYSTLAKILHNVILIYLIRTMNYYQSEKEAYVVPRAIVFDVKVEEGFASSGEGKITPGEEDSEWGN